MGVRHVELGTPVGLWHLVHDHVPILPPMEIRQQHQSGVGDEQDFAIQRRVLDMLDDVGDHPVAGLAVDRTEPDFGRQTGEVSQGLVDQENARLDEENLLAQSSQTMGVAHGGIRLRAATRAIYKIQNQMSSLQFKRKPARAGGHRAGFPLECCSVGLGPNCRSHVDCATLNSMALRQEPDA